MHCGLWCEEVIGLTCNKMSGVLKHNCIWHGHTLNDSNKNRIPCNTACINLRYEGGLRCPSIIIVVIAGIIIKFFDFLKSEELINDYQKSCSSPRVALLTFK